MLSFKDLDKKYDKMAEYKRKCINCNHTIFLPPIKKEVLCTWCGTINYYDKKDEFKEKIRKSLKNN